MNSVNMFNKGAVEKITNTLLLLVSTLIALPHPLQAQEQDLKFKHFAIEDGLSHSKLNCIFQDDRGFLWFGTNDGLNRFDGYNFTVYRWRPNDTKGLSAQLVRAVLEDSRGNLWIGTEGGGVNLFDKSTETFRCFTTDSSSEIRISGQDVNAIIEDHLGNLWLGTNNGLDLFDLQKKQAINYAPPALATAPHRSRVVNVVYEDRQNNLWVGTLDSGLWLFDRVQKTFVCFRHSRSDPHSLGDNDIRSIHEDLQGNLWIGTTFGGLNLFDRERKTFRQFYPEKNNSESTTIRAILDDGYGNLWVGNRGGLYAFDLDTQQFTHYQHDPNNPNTLSHNSIQCIFKDAKGDLWLGTRDGLSFMDMNRNCFKHYQARAHSRKFLNNEVVYTILEDRAGDLWFGTEEGGLNYLNRKTGVFTYFVHETDNPYSLSVNNIKALIEDKKGNLWVATFQGGLSYFNRKTNRFLHYKNLANDPTSLAGNEVSALLLDRDAELWVGTLDSGLDLWDEPNQRFIHFFSEHSIEGFQTISVLKEDRDGKIWIGSNTGLLGCWDKLNRQFKQYQLPINPISTIEIRSIFEDENGNFWVGTTGGGLLFFNRQENTFKTFTRQEGLQSDVIYCILQDEQKNLWLSSTNGLMKFNPQTRGIKTYYKENGLQSNQYCYGAALKSRSGEMFFGGINGVTAFYPEKVSENSYVPPVVITSLKIFNKSVRIGGQDDILKKSITETAEITLSYRQSVFSFEFAALNYATSAQNQYAYKMEGFDQEWNYVGNRRYANYTNLHHGVYTFRVKAANNDGVWNEQGASIRVTITPPFWQTWWFKVLALAFLLLVIKHFFDYQAQKRHAIEATSLANLSQLKLLRYQMNPHFLFNAHNSIRSMILIDRDRAWQMITELSEFFRYTLLNFNKAAASLDEEINAVDNYLHIERIRYMDSLQVSFQIDKAARQCYVPAFLFQPLVENAIRYGMQTSPMPLKVDVSILLNDGVLSIDVSNTGKLIHNPHGNGKSEEVHGTSLDNLKQRLNLMFKDEYTFLLYEENGWVHTKIRINYEPEKNGNIPIIPYPTSPIDASA